MYGINVYISVYHSDDHNLIQIHHTSTTTLQKIMNVKMTTGWMGGWWEESVFVCLGVASKGI